MQSQGHPTGVTAARLQAAGVAVFSAQQLLAAEFESVRLESALTDSLQAPVGACEVPCR